MRKKILCGTAAFLLVFVLCLPVFTFAALAEGTNQFIYDQVGLISEDEWSALEARAERISQQYSFGVYLVIVDDYTKYSDDDYIWNAAVDIWNSNSFGWGSGKDGMMLLLSMDDRDYDLGAYGDRGEAIGNDYAKLYIEDNYFMSYLRRSQYANAFEGYLNGVEYLLAQYSAGTPIEGEVDYEQYGGQGTVTRKAGITGGEAVLSALVPAGTAGAACAVMAGKNKSVRKATGASYYAIPRSMVLYDQRDVFTHTTESRVRIESETHSGGGGGGGSFHSGGGSSHHSGKF